MLKKLKTHATSGSGLDFSGLPKWSSYSVPLAPVTNQWLKAFPDGPAQFSRSFSFILFF
jgi:hypothetical protein